MEHTILNFDDLDIEQMKTNHIEAEIKKDKWVRCEYFPANKNINYRLIKKTEEEIRNTRVVITENDLTKDGNFTREIVLHSDKNKSLVLETFIISNDVLFHVLDDDRNIDTFTTLNQAIEVYNRI